jgi:hypothetical protein
MLLYCPNPINCGLTLAGAMPATVPTAASTLTALRMPQLPQNCKTGNVIKKPAAGPQKGEFLNKLLKISPSYG